VVIAEDCISDQVRGLKVEEVRCMLVLVKGIVVEEESLFYDPDLSQVRGLKVEVVYLYTPDQVLTLVVLET
jgi:hypothetical protein